MLLSYSFSLETPKQTKEPPLHVQSFWCTAKIEFYGNGEYNIKCN